MSLIICLEEQKVVGRHQIDYLALSAAVLQVQYVTTVAFWHCLTLAICYQLVQSVL